MTSPQGPITHIGQKYSASPLPIEVRTHTVRQMTPVTNHEAQAPPHDAQLQLSMASAGVGADRGAGRSASTLWTSARVTDR